MPKLDDEVDIQFQEPSEDEKRRIEYTNYIRNGLARNARERQDTRNAETLRRHDAERTARKADQTYASIGKKGRRGAHIDDYAMRESPGFARAKAYQDYLDKNVENDRFADGVRDEAAKLSAPRKAANVGSARQSPQDVERASRVAYGAPMARRPGRKVGRALTAPDAIAADPVANDPRTRYLQHRQRMAQIKPDIVGALKKVSPEQKRYSPSARGDIFGRDVLRAVMKNPVAPSSAGRDLNKDNREEGVNRIGEMLGPSAISTTGAGSGLGPVQDREIDPDNNYQNIARNNQYMTAHNSQIAHENTENERLRLEGRAGEIRNPNPFNMNVGAYSVPPKAGYAKPATVDESTGEKLPEVYQWNAEDAAERNNKRSKSGRDYGMDNPQYRYNPPPDRHFPNPIKPQDAPPEPFSPRKYISEGIGNFKRGYNDFKGISAVDPFDPSNSSAAYRLGRFTADSGSKIGNAIGSLGNSITRGLHSLARHGQSAFAPNPEILRLQAEADARNRIQNARPGNQQKPGVFGNSTVAGTEPTYTSGIDSRADKSMYSRLNQQRDDSMAEARARSAEYMNSPEYKRQQELQAIAQGRPPAQAQSPLPAPSPQPPVMQEQLPTQDDPGDLYS